MTGDEVIAEARTAFGETTALTLTNTHFEQFLNQAIRTLYDWLPPFENLPSMNTTTVTITSGEGDVDEDWDQIIEVADDTGPYTRVDQHTITNIDRLGDYFAPGTPVWYVDGERIYVRPANNTDVTVTYTHLPPVITGQAGFAGEIDEVPDHMHQVLVYLVASLAYSQEEDKAQAELYMSYARESVAARLPEREGGA